MDLSGSTLIVLTPAPLAGAATRAAAPAEAAGNAVTRRRLRVGETNVELRDFPRQRAIPLRTSAAMVLFVAPLSGGVEIVTESGAYSLAVGAAVLLARDEPATAVWREGSQGLVLGLPRVRLQAVASRELDDPVRLASVNVELSCGEGDGSLSAALQRFIEAVHADLNGLGQTARELEAALLKALARRLCERGPVEEIFPIARSVKRAADYVRANSRSRCSLEDLAGVAGVTAATLRQNFRACLGVSVSAYVQQVRLDGARARLMSGRESRPIGALAIDAGFSSAGVFSRAYQRRFGEIPSQTRASAVRKPLE